MSEREDRLADWSFQTMEERHELGTAVAGLMQTEGWKYLDGLLKKMERVIPVEGLREQGKPQPLHSIDYYLGQVEFIGEFRQYMEAAALIASERRGVEKRGMGDAVLQMMKPGGAGV